ncbi:hypothetical protein BAU15_08755 [Enterococcus sp. JM4C]|uniref:helix-turn-helix domain-containing protein n=1 Tax=Candidatus Enterococcus huntleyi TaxID=1857217 RepID=UPI00137B63F3|nr:helix-turn-helix domain-containing protein [Enterococcus sp. JM4C]KAF1296727.1 hypothetical protein BAU15_08755 [Enterococcus sp. JM4C]
MNLNSFLDQFQYPVLILQWLEVKKSTFCSIELLCDFFGISRFKALQYIEELNQILFQINREAKIVTEPSGEIVMLGVSNLVVKQVRAEYLMNSEVFQLLNVSLGLEESLSDFAERRYLGRGQSYEIRKKLTTILSEYPIKYKKGKLLGDELWLRDLIFSLYINYFYGLFNPFPEEIHKKAIEIENLLISHLNLDLTLTQKDKLRTLLSIILTRTKHQHFCQLSDVVSVNYTSSSYKIYQRYFSGSDNERRSEWQYIILFLSSEGLLEENSLLDNPTLTIATDNFLNQLGIDQKEIRKGYARGIIQRLKQFKLRQIIFPISMSNFSVENYSPYLEENYPSLIRPVEELAQTVATGSSLDKERFFVDTFFAILEVIPGELIEKKVFICVDFASGVSYSNFIVHQIEGFKNQNIIVQRKVTSHTDIFVSDYAIKSLRVEQIIWKDPPNADDWENFGNRVIAVKQKKSEAKDE